MLRVRPVRALRLSFLLCLALIASIGSAAAEEEDPASLATLHLARAVALVRGKAATLSLGVALGPGLHLLDDAPLIVTLDAHAATPAHRTLRRRDAVDPRADLPRFEVELKPDHDGDPALTARLTAWVCRGARCRPVEIVVLLALTLAPEAHPHP